MTPDDVGGTSAAGGATQPRARQNVILELGYFLGLIGRRNVVVLLSEGVELPSDYQGVIYKKMDAGGGWRTELLKELKAAGIDVDSDEGLKIG
jgi:predicted nucleotide-binding protein